MHGCGNDYIYINCFDIDVNLSQSQVVQLSNRHTGIGSDGVVLILRSSIADAKMRMFNSDGSEGNMCGNAIRCVAKYLYDNKIAQKEEMKIETKSGIKELHLFIKNEQAYSVKVNMGRAEFSPEKTIDVDGKKYAITCVSMGNPHAVNFVENVESLDLQKIGPLFENNPLFPEKVNTEFIELAGRNCLKMRVWERGSGETQACGTGACASAVAAVLNGHCDKNTDIKVQLPGGELIVKYTDEAVYMTGNCVKVFDGVVEFT
ncbi:diaminopimelate epimerase [Fibrobacteria bacterium R8-3-H12]